MSETEIMPEIFYRGFLNYYIGKKIDKNPFLRETEEYRNWNFGWLNAASYGNIQTIEQIDSDLGKFLILMGVTE